MRAQNKNRLLNIIGLLLGMTGIVIIFFYGPPQPSFFPYDIITDDNIHKEVLDMRNKYDLYSKIGLGFIFIGFLLQLFATVLSIQLNKKPNGKKEEINTSSNLEINNSLKK